MPHKKKKKKNDIVDIGDLFGEKTE